MTIKDIDYFLSIAKHQNISSAAKELYLSQPALSKYLHNLETRIGAPLFERRNNKLFLTKAGEHYISLAKVISEQRNAFDEKINRLQNKKAGKINIGMSVNLTKMYLNWIIAEFKQANAKCELNIEQLYAKDCERNILSGILDLSVTHQPLQNDSYTYQPLFKNYILLALSADSPLNNDAVPLPNMRYPWLDLNKLSGIPFILPNTDIRTRMYADEALLHARINPAVVITTIDSANTLELVGEGVGASIITENDIIKELSDHVAFHHIGKPVMKKSIGLLFRKGYDLPLEAHSFIKILKKHLPKVS